MYDTLSGSILQSDTAKMGLFWVITPGRYHYCSVSHRFGDMTQDHFEGLFGHFLTVQTLESSSKCSQYRPVSNLQLPLTDPTFRAIFALFRLLCHIVWDFDTGLTRLLCPPNPYLDPF